MSNQFPEPTFTPPELPAGTVVYIADWWLDAIQRAEEKEREAGFPARRSSAYVAPPGAMYLLTAEANYFAADLLGAE